MTKLNIAVAGAGLIGKTHLKLVSESTECNLAAIVDPSPEANEIAEQYQVPLYASLNELFAANKPDGVILATPNKLHAEQTLQCIYENVPAIVEKPVTESIEDGERVYREAQRLNSKVLVGHHRAYSPVLETAKQVIESNQLGKLVAIMGSAIFYKPDDYFEIGAWRTKKGGGPILINLIHEIGNLRYLMGEIVGVQAISSNATRHFEVEDTTAITLKFESGALGTFLLSDAASSPKSWEQTSQENKSYATYEDEDCYHVAGTHGSLSIPTMRLKSFAQGEAQSWWKPLQESVANIDREDPLKLQLQHFCDVINNDVEPRVSIKDGLQNLKVIDAVIKACETSDYVEVK
ncbi:gfo/Idh/MocA family oxidoreductase [Photobacterium sanctipauli]|uniref:Gfo/Idh/MocA family oxidoreductase n=1 Tax=Photobacterium sanctipauli TaxID=1342794 RepID=A0A2T3P170_9GAMM|nr:Gfo/Idh/MocA family oxidoreductase [Photobacterium sanctipauli]PSW22218.1 gfo/Idh/MocA family oxidoreductase [Photobacterium sanctipauli]